MTRLLALPRQIVSLTLCLLAAATGAIAQISGPLDFLNSKDSSFALFVNTSNILEGSPSGRISYPNELVLITGLPSNPTISARVDLLGDVKLCFLCGGLRNVAISPDGDTALVSSEPSAFLDPTPRTVSRLFLLRNLQAFVKSGSRGDLRVREFSATDVPQLDNVSGLAFGADGSWAVVNTGGPGYAITRGGNVVVVTGLPENPVFSAPFPVPMHSLGNIDLSLDGQTLLLNDTADLSDPAASRSNLIVVHGIHPGDEVWVASMATIATPPGFVANGPPDVRDARLTLDGRFVIAPIPLIRALDPQGKPLPLNNIAILGPVHDGTLHTAELLTEANGVVGGPYHAGVSPDGDSALVGSALDSGSANLLTGLSYGAAHVHVKPLPFSLFGSPAPKPHAEVIFTPDGDTALVVNPVTPPLAFTDLKPSISVLTGFRNSDIRLAANLTDPKLNPFDNRQQIATAPSGLMDYVNLYIGPGAWRAGYVSLLSDAVSQAKLGNQDAAVAQLVKFIRKAAADGQIGDLSPERTGVLCTLASAGIEALIGHSKVVAGGHNPGAVAPNSIATLVGSGLGVLKTASGSGTLPTELAGTSVRIVGPGGDGLAPLYAVEGGKITFVVPPGTYPWGKSVALVSDGNRTIAAVTLSVERAAPQLFTLGGSRIAAAAVQRVRADGAETTETVTQTPIDLGPEEDRVYLVLFGTGIRGRTGLGSVTAHLGGQDVPVLFAGFQPTYDGLDQVNLLLPRTLVGSGMIDVTLSVDGAISNTVQIGIL